MLLVVALWCLAGLILTACLGVALCRMQAATPIIYGLSLIISVTALGIALAHLVSDEGKPAIATLPLGLPWLGAHFRLDALAAFFLVVVNVGASAASLFALGYGRHEEAPHRVLPFYPAFLAG